MAVRIRAGSKQIICAAKSEPMPGDVYIDDNLHYVLGVELRVMSVYGQYVNGADLWEFHAPISMEEKIKKEERTRNVQTNDN